jgi:hypothetical protein
MPERRSAVMIMADAWWKAANGSLQKAPVRIVNKSTSGACIRSKGAIDAGAKLRIQSRWDEFRGVAKYCRSYGTEYLIGIQREDGEHAIPKQPAAAIPNRDAPQQLVDHEAARSPEHHRSRGVVLESGASDSSGDCPGRNRHVGTR